LSHLLLQGSAERIPLPDQSADLVIGSPPYLDARLYLEGGRDLGIARGCHEWVSWMVRVTEEAVRVCRGPVLWVCSGKTRGRRYQPGPEGLVWEWYLRGGAMECPCYWHRVGIAGSGGDQWFRKDVEYVLCFKGGLKFPWSDNTANGHPPKWAPGGEMSHRVTDGTRRNQWGHGGRGKRADRRRDGSIGPVERPSHEITTKADSLGYTPPKLANPGNLIDGIPVGGGLMGHRLAHENEAPYPERLVEWFVRSLCPPGGVVLDPFSGSGTTVSVAERMGRIGIGLDLRRSQAEIARQRMAEPKSPLSKGA
jgi:site-specific DNA-methyltransferase (adenine-specific)/site-specific DNA-methyltransferase (cytosine-N4-specific)